MTFESFDESQRRRCCVLRAPTVERLRVVRTLALAALAVTLAGCADFDDAFLTPQRGTVALTVHAEGDGPPPPPSLLGLAQPPRPRPRPPAAAAAPAQVRLIPPIPKPAEDSPTEPQPARATIPTSLPSAVAQHLLGLSAASLEDWLGQPQQRLDSAPARVWRYQDSECQLDAFLYLDLQTRQFHVLHYEVATNDSSDEHKAQCIRQILDRSRNASPGPGAVEAENRPH